MPALLGALVTMLRVSLLKCASLFLKSTGFRVEDLILFSILLQKGIKCFIWGEGEWGGGGGKSEKEKKKEKKGKKQ